MNLTQIIIKQRKVVYELKKASEYDNIMMMDMLWNEFNELAIKGLQMERSLIEQGKDPKNFFPPGISG